mgnify:CR=1 FL=1
MNILAVIPARGGSKGVPGKNKKLLNGKPLIQYSIDAALQSKYINLGDWIQYYTYGVFDGEKMELKEFKN